MSFRGNVIVVIVDVYAVDVLLDGFSEIFVSSHLLLWLLPRLLLRQITLLMLALLSYLWLWVFELPAGVLYLFAALLWLLAILLWLLAALLWLLAIQPLLFAADFVRLFAVEGSLCLRRLLLVLQLSLPVRGLDFALLLREPLANELDFLVQHLYLLYLRVAKARKRVCAGVERYFGFFSFLLCQQIPQLFLKRAVWRARFFKLQLLVVSQLGRLELPLLLLEHVAIARFNVVLPPFCHFLQNPLHSALVF